MPWDHRIAVAIGFVAAGFTYSVVGLFDPEMFNNPQMLLITVAIGPTIACAVTLARNYILTRPVE